MRKWSEATTVTSTLYCLANIPGWKREPFARTYQLNAVPHLSLYQLMVCMQRNIYFWLNRNALCLVQTSLIVVLCWICGFIDHKKEWSESTVCSCTHNFFVAMMFDFCWVNQTLTEAAGRLMSNTGKVQPSAGVCSALTVWLVVTRSTALGFGHSCDYRTSVNVLCMKLDYLLGCDWENLLLW